MKLLVSGYRYFDDFDVIEEEILTILKDSKDSNHYIIHGGCNGVDKTAGMVARKHKYNEIVYPADWHKYGNSAGPIRNQQMIDEGRPDYALIFLSKDSKGTKDMLDRIDKTNIPCTIIGIDND
jgi:hypothetical protein